MGSGSVTKKAATKGGSRPRGRSGDSHASCSAKRRLLKARVAVLEADLRIQRVLHESLIDEIREMMQGGQTLIPENKQL